MYTFIWYDKGIQVDMRLPKRENECIGVPNGQVRRWPLHESVQLRPWIFLFSDLTMSRVRIHQDLHAIVKVGSLPSILLSCTPTWRTAYQHDIRWMDESHPSNLLHATCIHLPHPPIHPYRLWMDGWMAHHQHSLSTAIYTVSAPDDDSLRMDLDGRLFPLTLKQMIIQFVMNGKTDSL